MVGIFKKIFIWFLKLFNISHHDIYLLKSISHSGWIFKAYNPFDKKIPLRKFYYTKIEEVNDKDINFCKRILKSYNLSLIDNLSSELRSEEWDRINLIHQIDLINCLIFKTFNIKTCLLYMYEYYVSSTRKATDAYKKQICFVETSFGVIAESLQ